MDFAHGQAFSSPSHHRHAQHHLDQVELSIDVGGGWARDVEREHMFDKVVTPSDVGKLNRLVIPKQHAEKYFPLDDNDNNNNKQVGVFLNFEDRQGKSWRFRYSYWNSSQSYVMTKGWSRFVKDKNLDAGDLVSFLRHKHKNSFSSFFIDWRRRPHPLPPDHHHHAAFSTPWTPLLTNWNTPPPQLFTNCNYNNLRNHINIGRREERNSNSNNIMELLSVPVTTTVQSGGAKKLRLFGVNMEMEHSTSSSSNNSDKGKPQSSNSNFISLDFHI